MIFFVEGIIIIVEIIINMIRFNCMSNIVSERSILINNEDLFKVYFNTENTINIYLRNILWEYFVPVV